MFMPALGVICQTTTGGGGNRQTWPTWDGTFDGVASLSPTGLNSQVSCVSTLISADKTLYVSSSTGTSIWAGIVTTTGIVEVIGAPLIIQASFGSSALSVCTLDSGRALLSYYDTSGFLTAIVLSISGSTVTKGTPLLVDNTNVASDCISIAKFNTDQSILCWGDANKPGYFSIVLSTSGTTVTKNTLFQFSSKSGGGTANGVSCCVLSVTSIFVGYTDEFGSGGGWGIVLSISGTTITTPTTELQIFSGSPNQITCCTMDAAHIMTSFGSPNTGFFMACFIAGTVITAGSYVSIIGWKGVNNGTSGNGICSINNNTAMVMYTDSAGYNIWAVVLTLSGISTTLLTPVQLTADNHGTPQLLNTCVTLDASRVIAGYQVDSALHSIVLSII